MASYIRILKKWKKERKKSLAVTARFRMGYEAKANYYQMSQKENMCRLYGEMEETIKHALEKCKQTRKKEKR